MATKAKKAAAKTPAKPAPDVASLMRALDHPLNKDIEAVRQIILGVSTAISEDVKWNAPSFRTAKDFFATVNLRAREEVQVIFHLGAKMRPGLEAFTVDDPKGLMRWLGKDRALVTLGAGRDIAANCKALEAIVRAWIKHL